MTTHPRGTVRVRVKVRGEFVRGIFSESLFRSEMKFMTIEYNVLYYTQSTEDIEFTS